MIIPVARLAVFMSLAICMNAFGQNIPKGFVVPKCTLSPDGRYGVTVPILDQRADSEDPKNSVIELKTGKIVAVIKTRWTGWNRMGHGGVLPSRWSPDGSLLLWEVEGKWFRDAVVLLKFKSGALEWQSDITELAHSEILERTKQAAPDKYSKAKKANTGSGSAYPEGFTIEVAALNPTSLPLNVRAALTSNPKQIEGFPKLGSDLSATVDHRGKFIVTNFRLEDGAYEKLEETAPAPEECPRDYDAEEKARVRK
jgi:hypothetical protein